MITTDNIKTLISIIIGVWVTSKLMGMFSFPSFMQALAIIFIFVCVYFGAKWLLNKLL